MSKPASSWNWRITEMDAATRESYARQHELAKPEYKRYYHCYKKGCEVLPEVYVRYNYVTGRAGRVSDNSKAYCRAHGEEIVAKKTHRDEAPPPLDDGRVHQIGCMCESCSTSYARDGRL